MKRICKFLIYIYILFVSSSALAYQIGVWDSNESIANPALNIKYQGNKIQRLTKANSYSIHPNTYQVIIFTRYFGVDDNTYNQLDKYIKNGGKIILALPQQPSEDAIYAKLSKLVGVNVNKVFATPDRTEVNWLEKTLSQNALPQGTRIANVSLSSTTSHIAVFGEVERHDSAISMNRGGSVISWCWGKAGSNSFNDKSMQYILDEVMPKDTPSAISSGYSQTFSGNANDDIKKLKETRENIEKFQSVPINFGTDISDAQQNLERSKIDELWALYYLKNNNTKEYENCIKSAKEKARGGVCGLKEISPAENRGIWFDRGTIVNIKSRADMGKYMEKLKTSGINTVYFETFNAGYTIYPSKIGTQNPLTKGRDPLSWAIEEAHARNMKLQAWVWIFAVGNDRHNKIIGKPNDYAGPVLDKNMRWALLGENGNMRPKNQPEFWIDPSNREGVNFLLSLIDEIVDKYNVDGIQLDYIRYPFQSEDNLMGFNHNSTEEFSIKTGEKLLDNSYQTNALWNRWKESNINNFVKTVYSKTKKAKSNSVISAAIFTKTSQNRLSTIQQNWETWAEQGYIDSLTPMSYSMTVDALNSNLSPLKTQIGNCLIYPGVALQHVNEVGIMEQAFKIREEGFPGVSYFALAQLTPDKSQLMQNGFYTQKVQDTNYNQKNSAEDLLNEYKVFMNNILSANSDLSQQQKTDISNMVSSVTEALRLLNVGKIQDSLYKIKQVEIQNAAFFRNYSQTNDLKRQTAISYLKRAENLIKIYNKKRA
ncbi:MAG: family 10 glycosylhydrolase [bacterium]|nr:family 10 glycosylhydrolase [bacterium]